MWFRYDLYFFSDGSNISGAWQWIPSHSQQLSLECTDYIPVS